MYIVSPKVTNEVDVIEQGKGNKKKDKITFIAQPAP